WPARSKMTHCGSSTTKSALTGEESISAGRSSPQSEKREMPCLSATDGIVLQNLGEFCRLVWTRVRPDCVALLLDAHSDIVQHSASRTAALLQVQSRRDNGYDRAV